LKLNKFRAANTFFLLPVFFTLVFPSTLAADYGVVVNEQFEAGVMAGAVTVSKTVLAPWFSLPLGDRFDLYFSGGGAVYHREGETDLFPELFRLEASFRPVSALTIRAGRIAYQDPALFTAKGRFDGVDVSWDPGPLRLSLGAYYTGFLYRNTANINVTPGDPADYNADLDYGDFAGTYFAPPRVLASLQVEYPGFLFKRGTLFAGFLSQYDLSDAPGRLHTQYLLARYVVAFPGGFDVKAAGAVSHQNRGAGKAAFATDLEMGSMLPGSLADRLALGVRWASGEGPSTAAYFPVFKEAQGKVLKPDFSGIMVLSGDYRIRLFSGLSAGLEARYLFRTDSSTFTDPNIKGESRLLGLEIAGSLLWVPLSDISLSLGGGVFLPRTGRAFQDDTPLYRQLTLGLICSF
jgi:hypothetical protein